MRYEYWLYPIVIQVCIFGLAFGAWVKFPNNPWARVWGALIGAAIGLLIQQIGFRIQDHKWRKKEREKWQDLLSRIDIAKKEIRKVFDDNGIIITEYDEDGNVISHDEGMMQ